jgi:hypothetical protein
MGVVDATDTSQADGGDVGDGAEGGVCAPDQVTPATPSLADTPPYSSDMDASCSAIGVALSTTKTAYKDTDKIDVMFAGLHGAAGDIITLAHVGYPAAPWVESYSPSLTSGTTQFLQDGTGTYVVRYQSASEAIYCQTAPFIVYTPAPTTVSTDKAAYVSGQEIVLTYTNLPNTGLNVIYLAVPCSPLEGTLFDSRDNSSVNKPSGGLTFTAPAPGDYVIRAISGTSNPVLLAESRITVTPNPSIPVTISTDKSIYVLGSTITVSYAGLPGDPGDSIQLGLVTDPDNQFSAIAPTNSQMSGTATFTASLLGSLDARAYIYNGTSVTVVRSAAFMVTQ